MISMLLEPWSYQFMRHALSAGLLLGVTCGIVGCFVVLKGLAFVGDALSHSILPGVVVAHLREIPLALGGVLAAVSAVIVMSIVGRARKLSDDTVIGVVFPGFFALGVMLISRSKGYTKDLAHILFGNILAVTLEDLICQACLLLLVLFGLFAFYPELVATTFDPDYFEQLDLPVKRAHFLLLFVVALTVVSGVQAVGTVMVAALLVTPAATARLLTERLPWMLVLSAFFGSASTLLGLYLSYYFGTAAGAGVVLVAVVFFSLCLMLKQGPQVGRF